MGEDDLVTLASASNLAASLCSVGEHAEAEAIHRKTLAIRRRVSGLEDPGTLASTFWLTIILWVPPTFNSRTSLLKPFLARMSRFSSSHAFFSAYILSSFTFSFF